VVRSGEEESHQTDGFRTRKLLPIAPLRIYCIQISQSESREDCSWGAYRRDDVFGLEKGCITRAACESHLLWCEGVGHDERVVEDEVLFALRR
jgi:hypothetical protein